jgi:hypothetical protein
MAGLDPVISGQGHNVEWALHYNQDEGAREQAKELLYQKLERLLQGNEDIHHADQQQSGFRFP